ncbi:hypothetical protein [Kaistia terrae]|uniref:YCII-related domain-containing protein n=1 Tax=Kaistia terrae TaxID=537017 RepID=A0ABW0Q2L0_9HYPH|nr:hypothetical protein [Kaistia terrae]MCX5581487.1 hypothetical protein [Kaistia terrae]
MTTSIILAMIRMTPTLRAQAQLLDNGDRQIGGRQIDNPLANLTGDGVIVGDWLVAARVLNDPEYADYFDLLKDCQIRVIDSDVMFLPPSPEE